MIIISNFISWEKPLLQESWTHTKIERAITINSVFTEIGSVSIVTSYFFDVNGISTSYYRIRFYDSVGLVYSDYSDPLLGSIKTDVFERSIDAVTILGTLGAVGPDSNNNFTIFGMLINQNVAETLVDQAFDYASELIGDGRMASTIPSDIRQIKNFIMSYSALKILGVLNGVAITTHFNYSSGGLNIQKPLVGQMKALMDMYSWETRRWRKLLLTPVKVSTQTDLQLAVINTTDINSGITSISYDFPNM